MSALLVGLLGGQFTVAPLMAQTTRAVDDEVVIMSPFEVPTTANEYAADNSLIATGFNREVRRTPLVINILTSEFLRDAGLDSYAEAADFMPNTFVEIAPYGLGSTATARGHSTSYYSKDGNRSYLDPGLGGAERLEVVKGPATLFFGRAQPGGIFNFSSALPSRIRRQSITATVGSYDKKVVQVSSSGTLGFDSLTHRLDAGWEDSGSFIDHGYRERETGRLALGWRPAKWMDMKINGERTFQKTSGQSRATWQSSPDYLADYNNPTGTQIQFARTYLSPTLASDEAAVTFLRNRWRESSSNWSNDTRRARHLIDGRSINDVPQRVIGLTSDLTPFGWGANMSGRGSRNSADQRSYGGEVSIRPTTWVTLKLAGNKYDLEREIFFSDFRERNADGVFRSGVDSQYHINDAYNLNADLLIDFKTGPIANTVALGYRFFKDTYIFRRGTFQPLNQAPDLERPGQLAPEIRGSGGGIVTAGWNPATQGYFNVRNFVRVPARLVNPLFTDLNEEEGIFASYLAEMMDGRLGLLFGIRNQKQRNLANDFEVDANLPTVGISWEVVPSVVLFASRSESFEPSNQYLVEGGGTTAEERNSSVAPPRSGEGWDIGAKFSFLDNRLLGTFSIFETVRRNDFRNVDTARTENDPRNLDANPNNNVTWYEYGGERLSRGAEFEAQYVLNKNLTFLFTLGYLPTAEITKNISLTAETLSYRPVGAPANVVLTLADLNPSTANQPGARSSNSPELKSSLWTRYRFTEGAMEGLQFGFGVNYVDEVRISNNPLESVDVPSFTLFRATVDYPFQWRGGDYTIGVIGSNLMDKRYYRATYRGEPRTVSLRLSATF